VRKGSFVGTPDYMPPELCKSTMSCFSSDLWSLGVVAYQCLTARLPFRGATEYLTMQKVRGGGGGGISFRFVWSGFVSFRFFWSGFVLFGLVLFCS
jgi:serine/threonine protein kinase